MVAEMNEMSRIECVARLAMGDNGSDLVVKTVGLGLSTMVKTGFIIAAVAVTVSIAAGLF